MKNIIITTILFLFSCSSGNLKDDYIKLKSKDIIIPNYKSVILNGKDTLFPKILDTKLKLVIFCDSTKCNSCAIDDLYGWKEVISNTRDFKDLSYYFIFNCKSSEIQKVDSIIHTTFFNYPIIFDQLGEFSRMNKHIPKNDLFHTFLLEHSNVIMIGNPRMNIKTMNLFKKTLIKYSKICNNQ